MQLLTLCLWGRYLSSVHPVALVLVVRFHCPACLILLRTVLSLVITVTVTKEYKGCICTPPSSSPPPVIRILLGCATQHASRTAMSYIAPPTAPRHIRFYVMYPVPHRLLFYYESFRCSYGQVSSRREVSTRPSIRQLCVILCAGYRRIPGHVSLA